MTSRNSARRPVRLGIAMLLLLSGALGQVANSQIVVPTDTNPTCTVTPTSFNSWFTSGSVTLNGGVGPANSVAFPNTPNCSFYQWSEQMFLWLTSPAPAEYGGGGGHVFESPVFFDISSPEANGDRTLVSQAPGILLHLPLRSAQVGPHGLQLIMDTAGRMFEIERPLLGPHQKPLTIDTLGRPVEIERRCSGPPGRR